MAFDPIAEGATLSEGFDPIAEGATLFEEKKKKKPKSFFSNSPSEEDFSKLSEEVLRESPYVAQGAIKEPFKMANVLLPKGAQIPVNKLQLAEKISPGLSGKERKEAESFGGMFALGIPRAGIKGIIKGIPHIGKVLEEAMKASPILNKLTDIGSRGAEFGLYEAAEHPENQLQRGALGFGLGAGLSGLGHGIPALAKGLGYGKKPGEEVLKGITYEQVSPQVEAAERLGTPLRPSEATGNPFIAGMEGRYPRTMEASSENVKLGTERKVKEKEAINKLLNTIYDKSVTSDNKVKNLYETAYESNLEPNIINKLKEDPLISDAFESVANDKVWQRKLEGKPENSFASLDKVRKYLSDQEGKLLRSGEKSKASEYKEARSNLVDIMDNSSPAYKLAREEAQRKIIRRQLESKLKTSEIKGKEFYKKIIKNENKFNELHSSLKNVPEAQAMLQDMKTAWSNLINVEKPSTSSYQAEKAINQARNNLDKAVEIANKLFGKNKNKEAVKFIRGDAWVKQLKKAQKTGKKEDVEQSVNDIMMKILPVSDFLIEGNSK